MPRLRPHEPPPRSASLVLALRGDVAGRQAARRVRAAGIARAEPPGWAIVGPCRVTGRCRRAVGESDLGAGNAAASGLLQADAGAPLRPAGPRLIGAGRPRHHRADDALARAIDAGLPRATVVRVVAGSAASASPANAGLTADALRIGHTRPASSTRAIDADLGTGALRVAIALSPLLAPLPAATPLLLVLPAAA